MCYRKVLRTAALVVSAVMVVSGIGMVMEVTDGYASGRQKYREWRERYTSEHQGEKPDSGEDSGECGQSEWDEAVSGVQQNARDVRKTMESASACEAEERLQDQSDGLAADVSLPMGAPNRMKVDFEGLSEMNPDIVGWIELPAAGISYPVVQTSDNEYYLHHSLEKEYLFSGCIFLDASNTPDFTDDNSIIYGHNMRDGSMFAGLHRYCEQETCEECPYFWIYTPGSDDLYRIFSVHSAMDGGTEYCLSFGDRKAYSNWYWKMKEQSVTVFESGAKEQNESADTLVMTGQCVTLSTCMSESGQKLVVQGERIASIPKEAGNGWQ
jgi:sortase B